MISRSYLFNSAHMNSTTMGHLGVDVLEPALAALLAVAVGLEEIAHPLSASRGLRDRRDAAEYRQVHKERA